MSGTDFGGSELQNRFKYYRGMTLTTYSQMGQRKRVTDTWRTCVCVRARTESQAGRDRSRLTTVNPGHVRQ